MIDGGEFRNSRGNMLLCIAVAVMSIIGLGANVYKANTGEKIEWLPMVGEACVLLAAGCFIYAYFNGRNKESDKHDK